MRLTGPQNRNGGKPRTFQRHVRGNSLFASNSHQAVAPLLADRADDAALRPRVIRGQLVLVREHFIVLRRCGEFALRHYMRQFVAARLELADQFRQRLGGMVLEVVSIDKVRRGVPRRGQEYIVPLSAYWPT